MTSVLFALFAVILALVALRKMRHAPVTSLRLAVLWLATLVDAYVIWLLVAADVARGWQGMTGLLVFNALLILCALAGPALFAASIVGTIKWVRNRR